LLAQRVEERTAELKKANAKLSRANRLKDEFLASMSHELRTPLSAILGMSEVLQKGIHGPLNDRQVKDLQRIEESGCHLLELINDILDVAKIGADKLQLKTSRVSVESVCQASLRFVIQDASKKNLRVSSNINGSLTVLLADERRLKQILVNLLSNAVKFTPEGGSIGLEVADDEEQQMVHFTVWDTGIGIPQEDMELLFQPFVQLDGGLSRQYSGTGLGLALVYKMTELHGGSISVESEVGHGSRFTISLPRQGTVEAMEPMEEAESAEPGVPVDERTGSVVVTDRNLETEQPLVLLTEDNEDDISIISDFLSSIGYRVVVARSGSEAIQRIKEERPDMILMDIQMPGMDGLEVIRRIRADADVSDIPIIALTALAMPGDRERCLRDGADDYISKPVSLEDLVKAMEARLVAIPD
jgi:CheY-like chemotaxis protein/nitrogen-specific signal transduction histidine kinase